MSLKHALNLTRDQLHSLPILILYLTDGCNSRCVTCDIWRNPRRNMAPALIEALAEQGAALGVRWAILSGGEAMQHPDWAGAAARFRAAGARVFLLTNGLFVRRQVALVAKHVDELVVSLDGGCAETYAAIRGVDAYASVLDGMAAASAAGVRVTTRTTVQRRNVRELPAIARAALDAGASSVSFLTVDTSNPFAFGVRALDGSDLAPDALRSEDIAALSDSLAVLERDFAAELSDGRIAESPAKLRRMLVYFRAALDLHNAGNAPDGLPATAFPPVRCNAPHTSVVVEVDGTIRPCYFLPSAGRLTPSTPDLHGALNSAAAVDLRAAYRRGQRPECARCVCPLYKDARSLLKL